MMTADQALNKLMYTPHNTIYDICNMLSREIYTHSIPKYTVAELVSWYIVHRIFDEPTQKWKNR